MPISLLTDTQDMLDTGEIRYCAAARFDLVSDSYGFWTGEGTVTEGGVDYLGVGGLVEVWDTSEDMQLTAKNIELTLRSVPDSALTPDVLATIESEIYVQKPVTLLDFFFDEDWALIESVAVWRGLIQQFTHEHDGNGGALLKCQADSREIMFTRKGWAVRTVHFQKQFNATDASFRYCGHASSKRIYWGSLPRAKD